MGNNKPVINEKDAIDKLPLGVLPLSISTLKNAKLIKNARMETTVELHNDPISGSLQLQPEDIGDAFAGSEADQAIIMALSKLNSYDVYSIRASLKKMGVVIDDDNLKLSDEMKSTLNGYAHKFARPLVEKIFGSGNVQVDSAEGLHKIFRDPDAARVKGNLQVITKHTGIPMDEIPAFLESYSDVFLSVAYYTHFHETVSKDTALFLGWLKELQKLRDVTSSPQTAAKCKKAEENLRFLLKSIDERLKKFNAAFESFWNGISRDSFNNLRQLIESNYSSMGAGLCGIFVKMNRWTAEFPDGAEGGPQKRIKFVISEIDPGLDQLCRIEAEARKQMGLTAL